ncbi:MAG: hypothetical protein ACFFG0_12980, partial [Candidatus Thorarchaeota archaeon]
MLNVRQRERRIKYKYGLIACFIIGITLFSSLIPFIDYNFAKFSKNDQLLPKSIWFDPKLADFLYDDSIDETTYPFNAYNESYIMCKIQNTDFTTFTFNNSVYNVSYGMNIIPVNFGTVNQSYSITISQSDANNDIFDWICVQPLYIKTGNINVNLDTTTDISFHAGGMISILIQPNFSYNWLYVEVDNVIVNNIYNTTDYPELDSVYLMKWRYDGSYLQFDLNMSPEEHEMKIKGNGSIDYKIIVNYDWDNDLISDTEEVQKQFFYSELDPAIANIWGHFERGDRRFFANDYTNGTGLFRCFIPEKYSGNKYLSINIFSGKISDIIIDNDELTFKNVEITTDYTKYSISKSYGSLTSGFHIVQYTYQPDVLTHISFMLDGRGILTLERSELRDTDADGVKDVREVNDGNDPNDPDSDNDGLKDGYDASPLASLVIDNEEICQIIIPHNQTKNTVIDMVIQRPEKDYSTGDETRIWDGLEVSIHPSLRLFGNSSITMSALIDTWDKNNKTYSLTGTFPTYGDGIPESNDENGEFTLIPAKISKKTFEFNLKYPIDHPAKNDGVIDIRFDVVWVVLSHHNNHTKIIHYYDFEDDLIIQSLTMREAQNVSYILASPDSMIENEILWNLIQNDELGDPSDFGVDDDIVGKGCVDYNGLLEKLDEIRGNNEISKDNNGKINETEVTYISFYYTNYDILNRINIMENIPNPDFEVNYSGTFENFFSFYIINEVKEEDIFSFKLGDDLGESKIGYIKTWNNYTDDQGKDYEERFNIIEFPISMKKSSYNDAEILETVYAYGSEIPLDELPYSINNEFHDKIILRNETFIEKIQSQNGIPELCFDYENDIYKESFDSRLWEVEASALIFNIYSTPTYLDFLNIIERINKINSMLENWRPFLVFTGIWAVDQFELIFWDGINRDPDTALYGEGNPSIMARWDKNSIMGWYRDGFDSIFYSELSINERLKAIIKFTHWLDTDAKISGEYKIQPAYDAWQETVTPQNPDGDLALKQSYEAEVKTFRDFNRMREKYYKFSERASYLLKQFKRACLMEGLKNLGVGIVSIGISVLYMFCGLSEVIQLLFQDYPNGVYTDNSFGFLSRLAKGLSRIALAIPLFAMGVHYIINFRNWIHMKNVVHKNVEEAFKKIALHKDSIKFLGRVCMWISLALIGFDLLVSIFDLIKFGGSTIDWVITIAKAISFAIPILITIFCTETGGLYGTIAGIIISLFWLIWEWLTYRPPTTQTGGLKISDDSNETYFELPEEEIKRHGSLEIGDKIKFHMKIENTGTLDAWMQTRFAAGGSEWSAYQGNWTDPDVYSWGETDKLDFERTLPITQSTTELKVDMEIDMWDGDSREEIYDDTETFYIDLPIMDSNIANFYDDLSDWDKPLSYEDLIKEYENIKDTNQHKDINETLYKLSNRIPYDWLNDTVGTMANGWTSLKELYGYFPTEIILRPDNDIVTYWSTPYSSDHWEAISEEITAPNTNQDAYIIAAEYPYDGHTTEVFSFENYDMDEYGKCKAIELYVLGAQVGEIGAVSFEISFDGSEWMDSRYVFFADDMSYNWHTVNWTDLNEDNLNGLQVRITAPHLDTAERCKIGVLYAVATFTQEETPDTTEQELISEKSGHKNVMMIELWGLDACYTFTRTEDYSHASGTWEFWLWKDNITNIRVHDFIKITKEGHIFEYKDNTLIKAYGIRNNAWNHIKIAYDSGTFDMYVNGIEVASTIDYDGVMSKTFYIKSYLDFRYDDPKADTIGIVYIDAVDFSWYNNYYNGRSFAWDYS